MICLVTGANGFVGKALCAHLTTQGYTVRRVVRAPPGPGDTAGEVAVVPDIGRGTDWCAAMSGVEAVVHLAARVHVRGEGRELLEAYRAVNVEGTRRLAQGAAAAGVRRFVFLSSIKVNGESSRRPFAEDDLPAPTDPYAVSKWEAEQVLREACSTGDMAVVILRPPLVYGPGVGANFLDLMRAVAGGVPLPLGAIDNRRSLLYLGNLVDAIELSLRAERASQGLFLVSDGEDVSTPDLIRRMARALKVRSRLVPVPCWALRLAGAAAGRTSAVDRLVGSLQLDSSRIRGVLGWDPPFTLDQGLEDTAIWYRKHVAPAA